MANERLHQVKLTAASGLAADHVINSFVLQYAGAPAPADLAAANAELIGFYNDNAPTKSLSDFISAAISRTGNACRIDVYDISTALAGGPHGSPISSTAWTLGAQDPFDKLPSEVSVALSLVAEDFLAVPEDGPADPAIPSTHRAIQQGAPATHPGFTKPRARRRGRVYLGPFSTQAIEPGATPGDALVNTTLLTTVISAAQDLNLDLPTGSGTPFWCIWSRRDATVYPITNQTGDQMGWIDNVFDSQRRRGRAPTLRTLIAAL